MSERRTPDIHYLKSLLLGLPKSLEAGTPHAYPFAPYTLPKHSEGISAAISKSIKNAFGWDSPASSKIKLLITARGNHVVAVADVLSKYYTEANAEDQGILAQSISRLIQMAEDTYTENSNSVCAFTPITTTGTDTLFQAPKKEPAGCE